MDDKKNHIKAVIRDNVPWIMLLVFSALFSILFPQFLTFRNITTYLIRESVITEHISAISNGIILRSIVQSILTVLVAMAAGALVGMANGLIVGRYRTSSIITTIGMEYVVLGITLVYTRGQHITIKGMYKPLEFIGKGRIGTFPFPIIIFLAVAVIGQLILSSAR